MGLLGLSMVKPEIIPAGCLQPFVAEDVFDVTHGTTVEKQSSGRSMTQDVRCDALGNTGHRPVPAKRSPDIGSLPPATAVLGDKQSRLT